MGELVAFFALLNPENAESGDYLAERCHINVWSLPGWLGHRPMAFDVGVLFDPQQEVRKLEMALPVRTTPRLIDLSDTLKNNSVCALLFGKAFEGNLRNHLQLKLDPDNPNQVTDITCVGVDAKQSELIANDRELTVAKLTLGSGASPGNRSYVRVRFVVDHAGTMWRWQRVLGRRNGLLIDFRAPDPREESRKDRRSLEGRAKPIGELDAFFMVPERYRLQSSNPELKYTRTLEGKAWDPYLRRSLHGLSAYGGGHQRLMVHRWHPETPQGNPKGIDRDHPFRGFLQFNREPAFRAPTDLALGALITSVALYVLFRPFTMRDGVAGAGEWVGDRVSGLVALGLKAFLAAGALALLIAAWKTIQRRKELPAVLGQMKRLFKRVEYQWFDLLKR